MQKKIQKIYIYLRKIAKGAILTSFIILILLVINYDIFFNEMLFYEVIPYYDNIYNTEIMLGKKEYKDIIQENLIVNNENNDGQEVISTFNPDKIEQGVIIDSGDNILGLDDITYIENNFGIIPESHYKEKFTYEEVNKYRDIHNLINAFYNIDKNAGIQDKYFDIDYFLNSNLKVKKNSNEAQVLIIHTHAASEFFVDSDKNNLFDGIVGAGAELTRVLEEKYNIKAIHHTEVYDVVDNKINRNSAYERIEKPVKKILEENPSIKLVLDIHRDGIGKPTNLTTEINGKKTAKIMFVNGLCTLNNNNNLINLTNLPNPYIKDNLALSFNMQMAANEMYPDFTRRILLKAYRFTNHLSPRSLLVEVGSEYVTKEEAFNAMEILADLVNQVVFEE